MTLDTVQLTLAAQGSLDTTRLRDLLREKKASKPGEGRVILQSAINAEQERLAFGELGVHDWPAVPLMHTRLRNALRLSQIHTYAQLHAWGPRELLQLPAVGQRGFAYLCDGLGWDLKLALLFAEQKPMLPTFAPRRLPALRDEHLIEALEQRGYTVTARPFSVERAIANAMQPALVKAEDVAQATFCLAAFAQDLTRADDAGASVYVSVEYPELCIRVQARTAAADIVTYRVLRRQCSGAIGEIAAMLSAHRFAIADWPASGQRVFHPPPA
jgi:hypothetical protein